MKKIGHQPLVVGHSLASPSSIRPPKSRGFALVVILAFVVLLTVLVLAYFSYSSLQRQISNASSSQATVDLFAQGAINTITSDFKQEIFAGSTNYTYGTNTVSIPLAASNAAPALVGTTNLLPNLIKRSAGGLAFSPGGASRASAVSTTNASQNGRSMSLARWNAALLLPKANTNSTDPTPTNFTPPDWILVNRAGGNPTAWNTNMTWSGGATNTNTVVGRYAYAIYDEGGLLDVNVAGYPPGTTNSVTGYKNALAYADLTQVGLNTNTIVALVGWRNTASAQPSGSFPNYTFNAASQTIFSKNVDANTNGFLRTMNSSLNGGESDRMFISRQQFIQFFTSLADVGLQTKAAAQNALQYLGTFSRGLDQPSFAPVPSRPKIIGGSAPPIATLVDSYLGNNDGVGGDDLINPSFLSIRAATAFTRWDGSKAVIGEPLVKKRFSLRRLAYLTFEGPSSSASSATKTKLLNAGVSQATIDEGTPANILKCFGLVWNNATKAWTYDHSILSDPPSPRLIVGTLSKVAAANREPDFAELLKAAINVGSLAKGGPNLHNNQGNYQYTLDTSVDYNILQIMANLVDQSDLDSYPTQIQIAAGALTRTFRGVEDLPYFYRYHHLAVVTRLPIPLLSNSDKVHFDDGSHLDIPAPPGTGLPKGQDTTRCVPGSGGLTDAGEAAMLYIPEVWNPHDASSISNGVVARPTQYQLVAVTTDPAMPSPQTPVWQIGAKTAYSGTPNNFPSTTPSSTPAPFTEANTAMTFSDDSGKLFREPTLLWRSDAPANANLSLVAGNTLLGPVVDFNTKQEYLGVLMGKTPISMLATIAWPAAPQDPANQYIFQGSSLNPVTNTPAGAYAQITWRLKYKDPDGNWITYDEKYPDLHGLSGPSLIVNTVDYSNNSWMNVLRTNQFNDSATGYDPRTARFGVGTASSLGTPVNSSSPPGSTTTIPVLEPTAAANYNSNSTAGNSALGGSKFTIFETQRPRGDRGNQVNYSNPGMTSDPGKNQQMRFFSGVGFGASNGQAGSPLLYDGLFSQNDSAITLRSRNNSASAQLFYEDPDGVNRRAMSAYADKSLLSSASTLGLPHATATTYSAGGLGVGSPTSQSQSRPLVLNRPFRSVGEMSYASRGGLWKQLDFFTPESGDTALLDTFCVNEAPTDGIVAGKVNLNTRQPSVLKAILAGACREELASSSGSLPAGMLKSPLDVTEAGNVANKLVSITSDTTNAWRGPIFNIGQIVGRFVPSPGSPGAATDVYAFTEPVTGTTYTYSGLSAALDSSVYTSATAATIQRLRESAIRPLAAVGQVRVWNVMIDVVAQVGRFAPGAISMNQFTVEGEGRFWVHLAIDRMTGKVIDKQVELITE